MEPIADIEFGWLPDGMIEVERDEDDFFRRVEFKNSEDEYITLYQECINKQMVTNKIEDSESAAVKTIQVNEMEVQQMEKSGEYILLWSTEQNVFALHSNLSPELLISVAEQIILKNR